MGAVGEGRIWLWAKGGMRLKNWWRGMNVDVENGREGPFLVASVLLCLFLWECSPEELPGSLSRFLREYCLLLLRARTRTETEMEIVGRPSSPHPTTALGSWEVSLD